MDECTRDTKKSIIKVGHQNGGENDNNDPWKNIFSRKQFSCIVPIEQTYSSIISFVPPQSKRPQSCIIKRVRRRVYGTQRRNAQSCGQNTAELSAGVFPSAEDLQGMNSRDESYTVYTPRGWKKGDEHAGEAWQINWESETTRGDTANGNNPSI